MSPENAVTSAAHVASPSMGAGDIKELRLALVCYGGVSLAVYMHGVTKEIQKLVTASVPLEHPPAPVETTSIEGVYAEALRRKRELEDDVATRVVVDVVAGTSAGGINGVFLSKALAHNLSQDSLRSMWLEDGDIKKLLLPHGVPFVPLKLGVWAARSLGRRIVRKPAAPPLDGDLMFTWIREALDRMDESVSARPPDSPDSLMPSDHALELFVTTTDFRGYPRHVPAYSPTQVTDQWHRHAMEFRTGPGRDQFDAGHNVALAFAARATSCFPGAFPPIDVDNIAHNIPGWGDAEPLEREFFGIYQANEVPIASRYFVDGGVLDNFPFDRAIEAILLKPAATEVDRRLLYIEPDPGGPIPDGDGPAPGFVQTIWGGLSTIPRHEPILNSLLDVRDFNERVRQVNDVVDMAHDTIDGLLPPIDSGNYTDLNKAVNEQAAAGAGLGYLAYGRLKLEKVVERLAELSAGICGFPPQSNQALFVADALHRWAERVGILNQDRRPSTAQTGFLRTFDLGYGERRIRFVISGINALYGEIRDGASFQHPTRADLDRAKDALYAMIREQWAAVAELSASEPAGKAGEAVRAIVTAFDPAAVRSATQSEDPGASLEAFLDTAGPSLDDARAAIAAYLHERLSDFGLRLWATFDDVTKGWDERVKRRLLVRYLGFPYWDVLTYPIRSFSRVGELSPIAVIRLSPNDVSALEPHGSKAKLKGVAKAHFGAFFGRPLRENDYLWGRLDAAERLLWMLLGDEGADLYPAAFEAILAEEERERELTHVPELFASIRHQIDDLKQGPPAAH
jgi:patatin-related protein